MKQFIITSVFFTAGFIGVSTLLTGCPRETPPCDKASLAKIIATCKDHDDCHAKIDEREKTCGDRIIEESNGDAGVDAGADQ